MEHNTGVYFIVLFIIVNTLFTSWWHSNQCCAIQYETGTNIKHNSSTNKWHKYPLWKLSTIKVGQMNGVRCEANTSDLPLRSVIACKLICKQRENTLLCCYSEIILPNRDSSWAVSLSSWYSNNTKTKHKKTLNCLWNSFNIIRNNDT